MQLQKKCNLQKKSDWAECSFCIMHLKQFGIDYSPLVKVFAIEERRLVLVCGVPTGAAAVLLEETLNFEDVAFGPRWPRKGHVSNGRNQGEPKEGAEHRAHDSTCVRRRLRRRGFAGGRSGRSEGLVRRLLHRGGSGRWHRTRDWRIGGRYRWGGRLSRRRHGNLSGRKNRRLGCVSR